MFFEIQKLGSNFLYAQCYFTKFRQRLLLTHLFKSSLMKRKMSKCEIMESDSPKEILLNESFKNIVEGKAEILVSPGKNVFYNPVQEFNRDLSVLVLDQFSKELQTRNSKNSDTDSKHSFRILEAFSASGLRSIRYAREVSNVTEIIANDISLCAIENINLNIKHNNVEHIVSASHCDAVSKMFSSIDPSQKFEAVDIDPYGSPTQFLDSAIQCVADGGLLMVTCTDTAILCGNFPSTCYVRYGSVSLKCPAGHEMAIRIVLQSIQSFASRYKRYIVPVLSISADFYIRVFVKVYTGAAGCKSVTSKLSMVYQCTGCGSMTLQPLGIIRKSEKNENNVSYLLPSAPTVGTQCVHCDRKFHLGGPIWSAPIHDQNFIVEMLNSKKITELNTSKRLIGMLSLIKEELPDVPLYYTVRKFSQVLKCSNVPIMTIRSAILNAGYQVSFSHASKDSIKTNAPTAFMWDLYKEWVKQNSIISKNITSADPADRIFNTPTQHVIDFSLRPDANPLSREMKLTRYQENPLPYWGPGSKSTTMDLVENPKKQKNQNKKQKYTSQVGERNNKEPKIDTSV